MPLDAKKLSQLLGFAAVIASVSALHDGCPAVLTPLLPVQERVVDVDWYSKLTSLFPERKSLFDADHPPGPASLSDTVNPSFDFLQPGYINITFFHEFGLYNYNTQTDDDLHRPLVLHARVQASGDTVTAGPFGDRDFNDALLIATVIANPKDTQQADPPIVNITGHPCAGPRRAQSWPRCRLARRDRDGHRVCDPRWDRARPDADWQPGVGVDGARRGWLGRRTGHARRPCRDPVPHAGSGMSDLWEQLRDCSQAGPAARCRD
jgi:hypothetical protein